jgi:hypothetical protein
MLPTLPPLGSGTQTPFTRRVPWPQVPTGTHGPPRNSSPVLQSSEDSELPPHPTTVKPIKNPR